MVFSGQIVIHSISITESAFTITPTLMKNFGEGYQLLLAIENARLGSLWSRCIRKTYSCTGHFNGKIKQEQASAGNTGIH